MADAAYKLTPRERQVMEFVCEGLSNIEIGWKLNKSPRTVEIQRANAIRAMGARNTAHAVAMLVSDRSKSIGELVDLGQEFDRG